MYFCGHLAAGFGYFLRLAYGVKIALLLEKLLNHNKKRRINQSVVRACSLIFVFEASRLRPFA
jgi:hypothetical protein